jgi:hypothetical protein
MKQSDLDEEEKVFLQLIASNVWKAQSAAVCIPLAS